VAAQAPTARPLTFWFTAGYGRGWAEGFSTAEEAFSLSASVQWRRLLVSGRAAAVSSSVFDNAVDLGLLGGVATPPGRPWHAGLAAGLGAVEAPDGSRGVGVPVEAQLFWRFSKIVGLGLYAFGDLNGEAAFGGATLALQVGRLR
jgi:hypothetical protein